MILNLSKHVEKWISAGILSPAQGKQILEAEQAGTSRPWVIFGVAAVGVTAIVTGIISLIAANWENIPDGLKLTNYFLVQSALGGLVYYFDRRGKLIAREMALFAFAMLFFGGIGLVAQIFNLHSAPWRGLFFWLVLSLPVTLLARSFLINHVWMVMVQVTAFTWSLGYFESTSRNHEGGVYRFSVLASIPFLMTALGFFMHSLSRGKLRHFQTAATIWGLGTLLVCGSLVGNFGWSRHVTHWDSYLRYLTLPWSCLLVATVAGFARPTVPQSQKIVTTALLLALGIYVTVPLLGWLKGLPPTTIEVLGAMGFLVIWSLAATAAAIAGYRRLFDFASFVIATRFIVVYFQVFGSLTTTGFGLIVSGSLILAVVYLWYRFRIQIAKVLGGKS